MANVRNVNVDRIKSRAKSYGITLKYLNTYIGKHDSFLSCVRNGTDRIDEEELAIIAKLIHTSVDYLTDKTDDPSLPTEPKNEHSDKNILRLAGRDGRYIERVLSDEQIEMLRALVDQLPKAPDDL